MGRLAAVAAVAVGLALTALLLLRDEEPAEPARTLERVIQDDTVFLQGPNGLGTHLDEIKGLGFTRLRLTAGWSVLAPAARSERRPEFDAADPAAYEPFEIGFWDNLDLAVREADARGIELLVDIAFWAPRWAADPTAGGRVDNPRTNIDVDQYRDFALAVVRRYDGSYSPPGEGPLPRVDMFSIWNEPNISGFFGPQWQPDGRGGRHPLSPHLYRGMLAAAYPAIKLERPETTVLVGGLAAGGSYNNAGLRGGVPPLQFLRELACIDSGFRPLTRNGCDRFEPVPGDGFSIHPYAFRGLPNESGGRDHVRMGDLDRLITGLKALAGTGRISPRMADVYITEFGYKTNPPDPRGISPARQLQYTLWSEALAAERPAVKMFSQFLVRDSVCADCLFWPTGYRDGAGRPKPLLAGLSLGAISLGAREGSRVWGRAAGPFTGLPLRFELRDPGRGWRPAGDAVRDLRRSGDGMLRGRLAAAAPRGRLWRLAARTEDGWRAGPGVAAGAP